MSEHTTRLNTADILNIIRSSVEDGLEQDVAVILSALLPFWDGPTFGYCAGLKTGNIPGGSGWYAHVEVYLEIEEGELETFDINAYAEQIMTLDYPETDDGKVFESIYVQGMFDHCIQLAKKDIK
jgi:hypothetical protein